VVVPSGGTEELTLPHARSGGDEALALDWPDTDGATVVTADEPEPAAESETEALTALQQRVLDFEQQWWRNPGAKEQAVRDTFDLSATRYYQLLNHLLDQPAALRYDPVLVRRLRRLRSDRLRARSGGSVGA